MPWTSSRACCPAPVSLPHSAPAGQSALAEQLTARSVDAQAVVVEAWALLAALPPTAAWALPLVEEDEPEGACTAWAAGSEGEGGRSQTASSTHARTRGGQGRHLRSVQPPHPAALCSRRLQQRWKG